MTAPWNQTPQGKALLAACVANPPRKLVHWTQFYRTADEWVAYDRDDVRVRTLDAFANEHFLAAERAGGREAALIAIGMSVDDAIDQVLLCNGAGREAA